MSSAGLITNSVDPDQTALLGAENISLKMGKIIYNGEFYLMAMISCDMSISKEADQLLLTKPI